MRAMSAAEERTVRFNPMAYDSHSAMFAFGRQSLDGAFEAIEHVLFALPGDLHDLVIIVSANLTFCHKQILSFAHHKREAGKHQQRAKPCRRRGKLHIARSA